MAFSLMPFVTRQFFDLVGNPLAGGKVYTYVTGTTTPQVTYTDGSGIGQNTNPIILDSAGRASIFLDTALAYKFSIYDSADVFLYSTDPVQSEQGALRADLANTASVGLGDALVGVKSTYAGGVARTQHYVNAQFVSILDFGAESISGGGSDASAALNLAETALAGLTNGPTLIVPPGTYLVQQNVTLAMRIYLMPGAVLKPASGMTITITGLLTFPSEVLRLFDVSLGGAIVLSTLQPFVTPQMWGAVVDGATDNTTQIQAAVTAAKASNLPLKFPDAPGNYLLSSPIAVTTALRGVTTEGQTYIAATGGHTDCFTFAIGNYVSYHFRLPSIAGFSNGAGVKLLGGVSSLVLDLYEITGCKYGISLEPDATNTYVNNNTINFNTIWNCSDSGIRFNANSASSIFQNNRFVGSLIGDCVSAILLTGAAGGVSWIGNLIDCMQINGGAVANSRGIYAPNDNLGPGLSVVCVGNFGNFAQEYIKGNGANCDFRLAFDTFTSYAKIVTSGYGVLIRPQKNSNGRATAIAAQATSNNRAAFNGGNPVLDSVFTLSLALAATGTGTTQDFYFYSPFTNGRSERWLIVPHFSEPIYVQCVEDESVQAGIDTFLIANQVHIRLKCYASVSAVTQYCTVVMLP